MKKMIVKSTTFGLVLALTVSCAKNDSKNDGNGPKAGEQQKSNSILGVWELLPIQDQGITLVMRIKFESKKATQTVADACISACSTCSVIAWVVAPVRKLRMSN